MRHTLSRLHDRVNALVRQLLFEADLIRAVEERQVNGRQHAIVRTMLDHGAPLALAELRRSAPYQALYPA